MKVILLLIGIGNLGFGFYLILVVGFTLVTPQFLGVLAMFFVGGRYLGEVWEL